jgi:hypothetical protein
MRNEIIMHETGVIIKHRIRLSDTYRLNMFYRMRIVLKSQLKSPGYRLKYKAG